MMIFSMIFFSYYKSDDFLLYGFLGDCHCDCELIKNERVMQSSAEIFFSAQQTWDAGPTLVHCWDNVVDGGPTLNRHRLTYASF